ncbi:MAG: pilus assembly PilX N-terminal domain-containing protein [Candidatus Latescibacterota bacterium]
MIEKNNKAVATVTSGERGFALVLVLVIIMTLTVLGIGVITSVSTNLALTRNYEVSTQAMNMAETAAKVAYREFINSGFLKTTHTQGGSDVQTSENLLQTSLQNSVLETSGPYRGWYTWEWDSDKSYNPLWDTDRPHGFRFRVFYVSGFAFVIESEGWYGNNPDHPIRRRIRAKGEIESMFQFSYFASRDLGEFVRGAAQEIRGKVHANGNMYVRPTGSDLKVNTSSFTATGSIIRSRDAWGRPDESGRCLITKTAEGSGIWVEMMPGAPRGSEGVAFDSFHANWNDKTLGAKALWGGVVRDKVPYKSPPPVQNLDSGGYYDTEADLHITNTTHVSKAWATQVTFWNWNEQRNVTVEDINVQNMIIAGDWPSDGLIYANTPIRLSNSDSLANKLMVASSQTIYTKGNFNTNNKKGASLMSKQRVYILSSAWSDALSANSKNLPANTTTINAALVDGAPTVDEYNWVDLDGNHRYDFNNTLIYDDWDHKTAAGFNNPANPNDPWANCDDLLENWNGKTLTKLGSTVHLNGGVMTPNLDNSGLQPDEIAWVRKTGYSPPVRVYLYDPDLATPAGQPPFTPLIGHIRSWEIY